MAIEIERKWLITAIPDQLLDGIAPIHIEQGYIAVHEDKTEVRVRKYGTTYWQTIKGPGHISRKEFEIPIDKELFEDLFALTTCRNLVKNRYVVPHGPLRIEIDEYLNNLTGLWVAEVEFSSMDVCNAFTPPNWFGLEISGDVRYKNFVLASQGLQ